MTQNWKRKEKILGPFRKLIARNLLKAAPVQLKWREHWNRGFEFCWERGFVWETRINVNPPTQRCNPLV